MFITHAFRDRKELAMSNRRSFKIKSFLFAAIVPKKIVCIYLCLKQTSGLKRNVFYQYSQNLVQKFSFCSVFF
jgi:hypothetical protein